MSYSPNQPRDASGKWSGSLMDSLEHQLRAKGTPPDKVHDLAVEIMTAHGTYDPKTGTLTDKGREREAMGKRGRIADRTARQLGHKPENIGVDRDYRPFVKRQGPHS